MMDSCGSKLLELCAEGHVDEIRSLLNNCDNNDYVINYQNAINGWTPLHWAYKRGYGDVVQLLENRGAKYVANNDGKLPADVAGTKITKSGDSGFVPNYLKNPLFAPRSSSKCAAETGSEQKLQQDAATANAVIGSHPNTNHTRDVQMFIRDNSGARTLSGSSTLYIPVMLDRSPHNCTYEYVVNQLSSKIGIDDEDVKYLVIESAKTGATTLENTPFDVVPKADFCLDDLVKYYGQNLRFDFVLF